MIALKRWLCDWEKRFVAVSLSNDLILALSTLASLVLLYFLLFAWCLFCFFGFVHVLLQALSVCSIVFCLPFLSLLVWSLFMCLLVCYFLPHFFVSLFFFFVCLAVRSGFAFLLMCSFDFTSSYSAFLRLLLFYMKYPIVDHYLVFLLLFFGYSLFLGLSLCHVVSFLCI